MASGRDEIKGMVRHKSRPMPPLDELRAAFNYDPETGILTLKARPYIKNRAGAAADYHQSAGYRMVTFQSKHWLVHRIAWYMHYGVAPTFDIDHIDRDRSNNRITNLRQVDVVKNYHNTGPRAHNTSGFKGVSLWYKSKTRSRWIARLQIRGVNRKIGVFDTAEAAGSAYVEASRNAGLYMDQPRTAREGRCA
jgi:hypothetical protein